MRAILWDGNKQINGTLLLTEKRIRFKMDDFGDTDLEFDLKYDEIAKISYTKIFNTANQALKILSANGKSNVFVVENPIELKKLLNQKK